MSDKLLLALQYWSGDRDQAMRVARLIADFQTSPGVSDKADVLFMARFDTTHDKAVVEYVSRKFNVHTAICRRRGVGWPSGCNDLWFSTLDWVYTFGEAKRIPPYKAIFTFEADALPLTPNWLTSLSERWDQANAKIVGPIVQYPDLHCNGNALFSGDKGFLKWVARDIGGCNPSHGWDYALRHKFRKQGWADAPEIKSFWKTATMAPGEVDRLIESGVTFLHGCKDDSVLNHVRARFLS